MSDFGKKEAVRKNWNGGEKTKRRGKLTITAFSIKLMSREWQWWDLIFLINLRRESCAIDGLTILLIMRR